MADRFVEALAGETENPFVGADRDDDNNTTGSEDRGDAIQGEDQAEESGAPAEQQPTEQPTPEPVAQDQDELDQENSEQGDSDHPPVDPRIPKHRLDQEIRKRRAVEAQLTALREQMEQQPQPTHREPPHALPPLDFGSSAKSMFDKVLDGELEDATTLFNDTIQQAVNYAVQQASTAAQQNSSTEYKRQSEMDRFSSRVDEIVSQYPSLDSTNLDTFDAELCDRVNAVRDGFVARGYRLTDALDEAVHLVLRADRPEYFTEQPAPKAPAPKTVPVKKHMDAASQQPPRLSEAGSSVTQHALPKVFEMDDDSFEKLSAAELAKMRGDFV